jgi:DNA repair exonuclease SbcCD ATPase subunit
MVDIQTMNQMITGLNQKKENLQEDEKIFLKLSGINEEIEKARQDKDGFEEELTKAKGARDEAKKRKADAVGETTSKIAEKMNVVLPFGSAFFSYAEDDDGKRAMEIGWKSGDKTTPYNGLSGGEKQIFDSALAYVLDANIIVVEAAELDDDNLIATLKELSKLDKQVLVNTCHPINETNLEPFKIIEVK